MVRPLTVVNVSGNTLSNGISNGLGGNGTVIINSTNTNTLTGVLSDGAVGKLGLTQMGSGTTILTKSESYSGATTVSGGTLVRSMAPLSAGQRGLRSIPAALSPGPATPPAGDS